MRILVGGASGLVGTALCARLRARGDEVRKLVRRPVHNSAEYHWDPERGVIDTAALEGVETIINLSGENIAARRWTPKQKARIRESRILATALLARASATHRTKPKTFISASAIGYYGDRGEEQLVESSPPGSGFLAETASAWEGAAAPAEAASIRVAKIRIGVVLSRQGGALKSMLLPFKLGLGARLGSGKQFMSWIALTDLVRIIEFIIDSPTLSGAINAVSPNAVRNAKFTSTLANVLHRPAILAVPEIVLRILLGEMGQELLLNSARVHPEKLLAAGFKFNSSELEQALL